MRIYLIDDDSAILSMLRLLIEEGGLGQIVGCARGAKDVFRFKKRRNYDSAARLRYGLFEDEGAETAKKRNHGDSEHA